MRHVSISIATVSGIRLPGDPVEIDDGSTNGEIADSNIRLAILTERLTITSNRIAISVPLARIDYIFVENA